MTTQGISMLGVVLVVSGCSINMDGSYTFGARSSPAWAANAPKRDVEAYYDAFSVDQLCSKWKAVYWEGRRVESILVQIASSLERRGLPAGHCDTLCRKDNGHCAPNLL